MNRRWFIILFLGLATIVAMLNIHEPFLGKQSPFRHAMSREEILCWIAGPFLLFGISQSLYALFFKLFPTFASALSRAANPDPQNRSAKLATRAFAERTLAFICCAVGCGLIASVVFTDTKSMLDGGFVLSGGLGIIAGRAAEKSIIAK